MLANCPFCGKPNATEKEEDLWNAASREDDYLAMDRLETIYCWAYYEGEACHTAPVDLIGFIFKQAQKIADLENLLRAKEGW